ncbi:hypothetical protein HMI49_27410 [Corallococcus exercitus]|uniref:Thiol-activated cytolysin C-terminal domain-containing protein n=1 Tax=Corallococcus exercitus TaxID=2316736 RepID=A0A7Y4KN82_9BACT|nr:thiol-activated cytolysin family protein [Corallococcus exercitus]NOK36941.1 hypothetical protein [Corallococcus exercitus]
MSETLVPTRNVNPALDAYIASLRYESRRVLASPPEDSVDMLPRYERNERNGGVIITRRNNASLDGELTSVVLLNPAAGVVFPGALVIADRTLTEGRPTPIGLRRAPLTLSVNLPGLADSTMVIDSPSASAVQSALNQLMERWEVARAGGAHGQATMHNRVKVAFSSQQVALSLGMNARWAGGSAAAQFDVDSRRESSTTVGFFRQVFYTVSMDTPPHPAAVFAGDVTEEQLRAVTDSQRPPAYVRSVDYGRILIVRMETNTRQTTARLEAAFRHATGTVEGRAKVSAEVEEVLSESSFNAVAIGGAAKPAARFVASELRGLRTFIEEGADFSRQNPGAPISYNVAFLRNNELATMPFTTSFTQVESVRHPNGFVRLRHEGGYVARFTVWWDVPSESGAAQEHVWRSGNCTAGWSHTQDLPGDARNVRIHAEAVTGLAWQPWGEIMNETLDGPTNRTYRVFGTTLDRRFDYAG